MISRRSFVRGMAAVATVVLLPVDKLISPRPAAAVSVQGQATGEGELYAGFLLLPAYAPVPSFVEPPRLGKPVFGDTAQGANVDRAATTYVESEQLIPREIGAPFYTFADLPAVFHPGRPILVRHSSGEPYRAVAGFLQRRQGADHDECTVSIDTLLQIPKPFPFWSAPPGARGTPLGIPEKVDFLPSPGIAVQSALGYLFLWIERDILYSVRVEYGCTFEEARQLLGRLTRVTG